MTSLQWADHFTSNANCQRINWNISPNISQQEIKTILSSLQAWQLGETSDGHNLLRAATKYALQIKDMAYIDAIKLFIREEQKHGNNLGRYLDAIGRKRISYNWGDYLFRRIRYFNTSMEIWTLTVIVVESTAQIFYQSLKDATNCFLLKQICTDILIDEAYHITFQTERMSMIFHSKNDTGKMLRLFIYKTFLFATSSVVWFAHRKVFKAGGNSYLKYIRKMSFKYGRILKALSGSEQGLNQTTRPQKLLQSQYFQTSK